MNYLKVLAILSLLFIFCGSVYGADEADSPDINGVNAVIDDTITVENASLTYDKLITSNNCEEVVIGDNSIWDVPIREGPIVENDNTSIPDITLKGENGNNMSFNNPADVFINESFNFQMVFKNLGDATGFQPYIQLIAPKELTHFTVSYSNRKIVPIKVGIFNESTYDNTTGLYTLRDPFTKKEVHGPANSTFYILQYPLGSFTVDAPDAVLNITSGIGVLKIGKLLNFTVTPVFRYGNSPIDDPVNYPPIYGETVTGWVNPVVVKIDKSSSLNEHETATGSNFPFSYSVNINIANGAKIENITITDVIPSDVMYLGSPVLYDSKGRVIDSGLYTIEEPAGNKTGGKLILKLKEAVGDLSTTSITLKYKAYAPEFDNSTGDNITIINSETGECVAAASTVDMNYTYVNDTYNASNSYSIYLKSLATQKYSEILTGSGQLHPVVPHNLIVYKIDFEISDYFAFDDLVIYDKFDTHKVGSAQKFLTEYEPVLSIYGKTYELNESYYSVVSLGDIDESVTFYISKFLKDNNISTSLKGGYYTNRSVNQGAMVGSLNFVAKVIIHYSNGSSVVSNDLVINYIKTSATVLNTFNTVSDNSYTQLRVPSVTLKKDIIAVDGEIINDTDFYKVYPGQNITFVLDIHFPTGSVNDFIVTDFLPIPLFNLKGFNLVNSTTGVIPKCGYWAYANDSGFLHDENTGKVIVPKIGIDTFNNALSFNFGNTLDNLAHPVDVRLWFTFQVSSEPMADQLNLTNLAEMKFKDSIDVVYASLNIVLMLTNEPELKITKYVNDTKILENIENATEVEYNITITNTGHSAAYDIIVADDFVNRTTSNGITKADVKSVSLVYSNGTVVDITAFKDDLFTKGYMIAQLAQNTSCSIVYTVRFSEYLIPKESIVNNVWITNFAAYPNSTNFATNKDKYRDNATIIAKGLNITKEFIGSNVTDNTEILFVGEVGIYKITVNFPDLRVPNLVIKDESYGIKYTNFTITTSDGVTVPEYAYTVTYTPSATHPEKSYLTIDFNGDLVPAYAKNNQLIVNAYYTVVNNENVIPTGADSVTTSNHASISWTNNTLNSDTVYVDIYQPKIDINKVFGPNIVQGNDEASFTITVTNSSKGTAYNTTITDDLTEFIKTFVNSRSDIGVTILKGNETGKVIFNWNNDVATLNVGELLAGQSVSAKFTFNVKNDVVIGKEFKNIAKVDYYSIFNETKFDEKRNYSNQASSTLHTYDAKVNKTVFNTTIVNGKDKVTVGENVTYNITVILPVGKYNILKITDTLPEGLKYIDGSIVVYKGNTQNKAVEGKDYTVTVNGNIVELTFASEFADEIIKEYGGKFQAFLNATVLNVNNNKAGAVKTNKAVLTWNTHESTSDAAVGIVEPAIDITKNFNVDNVIGGDVIYFDITVTNRGQSPLFNVTLSDDLTDLISKFVSGSINITSGGAVVTPTWNNNIVNINIAELGIGKSLTYRFTFKIREDVIIGSSYTNTVNAIGYSAPSNGRNYTDAAKDSFTTKLPVITKWVVDSSIDNGRDKVTIGEKVIYGVNVTLPVGNYTKLVIKDTLPQGFEYIGAGAFYANGTKLVNGKDWTVNVNNYDITITINNVHSSSFANGILSINLTARPTIFDPSNKEGAVKVNNVELFLNDKTMGKSSAKVTIVEPTADITKKFNVTEVEGLDHVSFDVIVKNNGKTPLFEVTIIDDLEDLASFIGQTPSEDNVVVKVTDADGNPIDAKIKWIGSHVEIDVAQLNPGDIIHAKYSFVIRSDIQIGSQYVNMANVVGYSAPDYGRNYYNESKDTLKTKMPSITKLVIGTTLGNKEGNIFTPNIGENVTYQIMVKLPKGNYTNLQVKDILPQGFEYLENSVILSNGTLISDVSVNGNLVTINFGNATSYKYSDNIIFNLSAVVLNDQSNKAQSIKSNNVELYLNDDKIDNSNAQVKIAEPNISVVKTSDKQKYEYYENATYSIVITNNGNGIAYNITIKDVLPLGLKYTGINSTSKSNGWVVEFDENTRTFTVNGLNLTVGDKFTFTYKVSFDEWEIDGVKYSPIGQNFINSVNVAYVSINGTNPNNRTYTTQTTKEVHVTEADLNVVKNCNNEVVIAGEDIYYTIIITNNGLDTAQNVKLNEYYHSEYLTNLEYSLDGKTWNVYNKPIDLGNINSKASKTVYIRGHLDAGIVDDTILNNTVRVNTTTGELKLEDNEATNIKNVTTLAELHVTKVNITEAIAGKIIKYEIVITNNGPSYARDIILKDIYNDSELTNMLYSLDGQSWTRYDASINIGTLANGQNKTILFEGFIKTTVRGNVINKAVIGSSTKLRENSTLEDDVAVNVKGDTTLDITKVANTTLVNPGDVIKYTVQITAGGLSDSLDVILTDNLSEMFFDVSKATYSVNGIDKGVWIGNANLGTISSGMTVNVVITVPVKAYVDVGKLNSITNFASVINSDKKAANDTNIVPINVIDLAVNKTANHQNKTYNYGDNVEYVIEIVNNGPGIATDIIATDNLPEGLKFINANVPGGWTLSISNNKITINGEKLANGEKVLITIIAKAAKSNTTLINNIKVNGTGFDSNISNNNDSETIKITPLVDLAITKVVDNANPLFDSIITYTITVVNNGPDKSFNVTVGDLLPDGVKFISSDGRYDPVTGVWFVGDLDANESVTLKIVVQVIKVGNITNNVNVTGTGHDTNLTNNNDSVSVSVPDCVILDISKVANSTVIVAGENVGYTVVINNYGPSVANDVVLKDVYNVKELFGLQYSLNGKDWFNYNEAINLGNIDVGASVTVYFRAKVNASVRGDVLNIVNIITSVDDARGNFTDNETVNVIANTTLVVIKDAEIKELNPGDTVHFIVTVIAGGSSDSLNVNLNDILDNKLLDINSAKYSINGGILSDFNGNIYLGNMLTGTTVTVDIWAKVLDIADRDIFNLVNVTSDEHPEGNTSNVSVHVRIVDLAVDKLVNNSVPKYLDMIEYTIVVVNNGPDKSFNVTVGDLLPDGVKFISSNGQYNPDTGVWFVGDLDANESVTLKIVVQVLKIGNITNNVNVTGTGHDTNLTNNNDSVSVSVPESVLLNITKVANSTIIVAGENVGYTVTVTNYGPSVATNVVLKDIFNSKELLNLQYSLNGVDWLDYDEAVSLGNINVGANITVYFRAKVNGSVRGDVLNIVNITTGVDDARGNFTDNETVNVIANTTLVVIKDAEIKELNPGDTVHFIITVIAGGSSDSLNVNLNDILDAKLLDVAGATYAVDGVNKGSWTGSIDLGNMLTGTAVTVDIWVKILSSADRDVFNLVNVTSDEHPEGNISNTTVHVRIVDLAVDKLVNNSVPKYLDMIEYTIVVVNNGPDKSFNVTVGDLLPDGVKFISSNGQYNPDTGVWFVGDLDANESVTLKIVVQVIKVGNITNNVNVTGTGHDTNLTNNNASVSVNVPESVLLNITKVANSTIIVAGENVGYTVVINNYGPSVASDVVLKDIFNSNELLNLQYSLNGVDWLDYNEAINLGNIDVGASVTVYFRAKVNGSVRGDVLNIVNITTGVDDARGNFTDNETVNVIANTTLVVIKDAEIKALNPGDTAHFVITVIAGGSSDSLNVKLEDILDAGLLDVKSATYRINGGNLTDYTQIISLGNMHTGSKIVVDIYAAILGTTGQDIFNCVNVTSDEHPEGNTSNTTIHVNIADLEIIKIVNNATPNYGYEITYTITVRNNGPDNSTNIKVSEVLADNFKFISANASKGYYDLTNGVWAVGNLTNNETAKLVIAVKIVKTGFIQNNVSVNGTGFDPNVTNNNATVNITVPQTADLSVVKIVNVDRVSVGNRITYTIVVKNNGPDTALDVYAVDKLSDALKFVSYKASVGVYDPATGIWTIGNLTNKSNATLEITCIVLKTGVISNEVFVNGSTVDLNMTNNYGNVSVTVIPAPAPVHPADKDIMDSDEVAMGVDAMAKTGNPILALLVVLIFGIFGFGVSRRKK
ncbi:MAG TPA: isopeptide-forming domain-containing fimbrial protein [Methanobrevibacter smithii]|nr:isopeptide-forming domain-containing fimbrial protein [Methanobrevibacter smithii]HJI99064.1 isopeptide-forming domain-containing fimbrial protein [Methanobrevibacter smithii]